MNSKCSYNCSTVCRLIQRTDSRWMKRSEVKLAGMEAETTRIHRPSPPVIIVGADVSLRNITGDALSQASFFHQPRSNDSFFRTNVCVTALHVSRFIKHKMYKSDLWQSSSALSFHLGTAFPGCLPKLPNPAGRPISETGMRFRISGVIEDG